jgi:8-oxo-dGTP diphosphatase
MTDEKSRYTVLPRSLVFVFRDQKLLLMRYSGKGTHQTQEKADRKDIYNPLGGHIEEGENVIENARREAQEEAGVLLQEPKLRGVINVSNFAGKNVMMFVVMAQTLDEGVSSSLEGDLEWVSVTTVSSLNLFPDLKIILDTLLSLKPDETFAGTALYDGKFGLLDIKLVTY